MLPKAYIQSLDTVIFDPQKHPGGNLRAVIDDSFAKAMIYSTFYEIVLSPNQVLDLALLREPNLDPTKDPASYPFTYSIDSSLIGNPKPFTANLLLFLRRGGKDSFVFSSLHNNWKLKDNWGKFIEESNKKLTDDDLIAEAKKTPYGEIVEWAEKLDKASGNLTIDSYNQSIGYQDIFRSFLNETQYLGWLPSLPKSRSEAYALIDEAVSDATVKALAKQIPDFVSNIQYAKGLNSRLSIESTSIIDIEATSDNALRLNLNGLLSEYQFVLNALVGASYTDLSRARKNAQEYMSKAWDIENSDPKSAIKIFGKGLREFLGVVVGTQNTQIIQSIVLAAPIPYLPAIANLTVNMPARFITKLRLRGLDKFINFKNVA